MSRSKICLPVLAVTFAVAVVVSLASAQEAPQPGPEHKVLKALEGEWDATMKMGDQESKGKSTYKMDLGGLWLVGTFEGEFGGQKFSGRSLETYDATKKKYVSVWADSMTTLPLITEGEFDKAGKVQTMKGEMRGTDGQMAATRMTTEHRDANTMLWTLYGPGPDGKEAAMMTITYTRKK